MVWRFVSACWYEPAYDASFYDATLACVAMLEASSVTAADFRWAADSASAAPEAVSQACPYSVGGSATAYRQAVLRSEGDFRALVGCLVVDFPAGSSVDDPATACQQAVLHSEDDFRAPAGCSVVDYLAADIRARLPAAGYK